MSSPAPLVLHVIHHLVIGGMENGLVNLINRMPASRFRHAIACIEDFSDFRQRLTRRDVEVIALRRSAIGVWQLRKELFHLCRRLRPTIVHSRNMSGLDAVLPAIVAGVPWRVHGEHGWDMSDLGAHKWKPAFLRRLHSPFVNRYITVSQDLKRYLVERVHIANTKIIHICNGVDTDRFRPAVSRPFELLPPNFADRDSVLIGTVGRIQKIKDQETLVRAFAALKQHDSAAANKARLAIIGDGPLLPHLRELVDKLGISHLVWLPGAVSNVPELMRTLDIFVLPSLLEGISNTILEAMASGLPVLATAVGGNVELVENGRNGYFFQPGDIPALTKLLAKYIDDPKLHRTHSQAARDAAVGTFGLDAMVRKYQAVYDDLCGRNGE